jgi:hypothetical protein
MAVFVSGSDESSGTTQRDNFLFSGFVGPENDWSSFFVPAWQERVLDGPPAIPYLHMTDMRSKKWRARYGISRLDVEDRIDEAISLIGAMGSFYPMCVHINAGHFRDEFATVKASKRAVKQFEPDYICFLQYVFVVLNYLKTNNPEVEKVDFIVERKLGVTKHIQEFHSELAATLKAQGKGSLADLVGELIPAGKDRVPLQAADLLCWHLARRQQPKTMNAADMRRYKRMVNRKGQSLFITKDRILELKTALPRYPVTVSSA